MVSRWWVLIGGLALASCGGTVESDDATVFELDVGVCFDSPDASASDLETVPVVPCDGEHMNEVFAVYDLSDAPEYPGTDTARQLAHEGCLAPFTEFVDVESYEASRWYIGTFYPSSDSWVASNDREVICFLYEDEGPVTGSARGSGD